MNPVEAQPRRYTFCTGLKISERLHFRAPAALSGRDDRRFTLPGRRFLKTTVFLPQRHAVRPKRRSFCLGGTPPA
jgi:hypothetical protein